MLNNKLYDVLKWIAMLFLPALATLISVVFAVWNDLDLTIDTVTQATKGCIRIVINAYVDFKVARGVTLAFGEAKAE